MPEKPRGPRISDARALAQATCRPMAIVIVFDDDDAALIATWGEDKSMCRRVEKRLRSIVKVIEGGGTLDVDSVVAEMPDDDGEAEADD